jgi:hypothetical protein
VRGGLLEEASDALYDEAAVLELVIVALLLGALDTRQVEAAWRRAGAEVVQRANGLPLDSEGDLLAVVDVHTWELRVASSADELRSILQARVPFPRASVVFDLGPSVRESRRGFWSRAAPAAELRKDRRRKRRSAVPATRRQRT